jgi:asparagine synthase (glutamine-hydrolysing)
VCGIAGAVGPNASESAVEAQLRLLEHRGPDASGIFEAGPGTIGQTRLSVIDLLTGDPPMTSELKNIGAVLNGEIYNYRDLRKALLQDGHVLRSEGDTEVITHLAESTDPVELAGRLDGMFAFAVWDSSRQRVVLGRDRLGKKPLYYWTDGTDLVFASEIKALLVNPLVPCEMDTEALPAYLTFGYVPTPRTFYKGIQSVPPGHVLTFEPGSSTPRLERYWQPVVAGPGGVAPLQMPMDIAARRIRELLSSAVDRRLIADVPVGAFLSGGIDSSSVVALMSGLLKQPVATFTIGFEDTDGFDERPYARLVAQRYKTDHTEFVVKPDAASLVEKLVWHYDQPFGDSSALPTYLLSELTRKHVTVALSGDGADELFAGYERFAAAIALSKFQRLPVPARDAAYAIAGRLPEGVFGARVRSMRRLLACRDEPLYQAFLSWVSYLDTTWRRNMLCQDPVWGLEDYRNIWERTEGAELLDRLVYLNINTYLLDDLLPKVDRTAMAHALEVRSPFLDTALVEFALRLPPGTKMRGISLKRVLKQAMVDLLPREVLRRPKRGFGVPIARWFRRDLRAYVEGRLLPSSARLRSHLNAEAIDRMVGEHMSGRADHGHALWTLLTLEEFLRKRGW